MLDDERTAVETLRRELIEAAKSWNADAVAGLARDAIGRYDFQLRAIHNQRARQDGPVEKRRGGWLDCL